MARRILLSVLVALAVPGWAADTTATVTIDTGQPGVRVSPTLYGIFFEEINRAGEGGLYAELLRNRAFRDAKDPQGWAVVAPRGSVKLALDPETPLNERLPISLKVTLGAGAEQAGVANDGFGGIPIRAGQRYALTLHVRGGQAPTELTASLQNRFGRVLASAPLGAVGGDWVRRELVLTPTADDSAGRLVVSGRGAGTFWLGGLSLLGETFNNRPNGLRPDLARMLRDLKPAFVRFPGGCYVEGDKLANAFRWKDTVGDNARRPGHWNLWGYRSSDGLGYHEYLQLCEDVGAEPLFVINCGMSHSDSIPDDQLGPWVQDALDAVEYANGPVDSPWGAQRAAAGHPRPFGLKYLEIGNENGGPVYDRHYALFHDALKAKYPAVTLVANVPTKVRPIDISDEHYYESAESFLRRATQYDTYPRDSFKIYVGEYAVTQGAGQGNLRAALGEAGFMCGLERNSDVVTLASYAPLFVRADTRQWNPDAIVFDNTRCCGTPSYWVQQMFGNNRADQVLPAQVTVAQTTPPPMHGAVGVGTWVTQAEYKDISITRGGQPLLTPDLKDLKGWHRLAGDWSAKDGVLTQRGNAERSVAWIGDPTWTDYTYRVKARKLGGAEGFLILFHVQGDGQWAWWNLGGWGNSRSALESQLGAMPPGTNDTIETGRWYDIRIETAGRHAKCFLDDRLLQEVDFAAGSPFHCVAGRTDAGEVIVKLVNYSADACAATVDLKGLERHLGGTATVLTADDPADENSLDQPQRVVPVSTPLAGGPGRFDYRLAPWSVTILRLKTR